MEDNNNKGIGFFNIKSGETHYARLEPQIMGYINSSDIGINASRGQDFGWRLEPVWVKKVKEFRRNETKMALLTDKNGGRKPTTTQVLYAIYGEQLRANAERASEEENPFEEEYLQQISSKQETAVETVDPDEVTDNFDAVTEEAPKPKSPSKK